MIALYAASIRAEAIYKKTYRTGVDGLQKIYPPSSFCLLHSIYGCSLSDCGNDAASNVSREDKTFNK